MKYKLMSCELFLNNDSYCSVKAAEKGFYKQHAVLTLKEWNELAKKHGWQLIKIVKEE